MIFFFFFTCLEGWGSVFFIFILFYFIWRWMGGLGWHLGDGDVNDSGSCCFDLCLRFSGWILLFRDCDTYFGFMNIKSNSKMVIHRNSCVRAYNINHRALAIKFMLMQNSRSFYLCKIVSHKVYMNGVELTCLFLIKKYYKNFISG